MELRRKLGDHAVSSIQERATKNMYLQAACSDILRRVRSLRVSAGNISGQLWVK
jgi:adenylate cyclase class IV